MAMYSRTGFVYLTYKYHRDVFIKGGNFKPWVKKVLGDNVKFDGFAYGMYEPSLKVHLTAFEKAKDSIPTKNLIKIKGSFTVLQYLSLGINDFENVLKATP